MLNDSILATSNIPNQVLVFSNFILFNSTTSNEKTIHLPSNLKKADEISSTKFPDQIKCNKNKIRIKQHQNSH